MDMWKYYFQTPKNKGEDGYSLVLVSCNRHRQWSEKSIRVTFATNNHDFVPSSSWIGIHKDGRYIFRKWIAEDKGWSYELLK